MKLLKRQINIIRVIALCVLISVTCISCNQKSPNDLNNLRESAYETNYIETENIVENTGDNQVENSETGTSEPQSEIPVVTESELSHNTQPDHTSYIFNSLDELREAFSTNLSSEKIDIRENWNTRSESYKSLVEGVEKERIKLRCPVLLNNGSRNPFATSIILYSSELYGFPWIWYQGVVNELRLTVKISYVSEELINYANNHSMSETVRYISPSAPNVDNYESKSSYSLIADRKINVNGKDIDALISQTTSKEMYIQFVMDNMLVVVSGPNDLLTNDIVSNIYFVSLE